jgi:hypothetical protein
MPVDAISRQTGEVEASTHLGGYRVNRESAEFRAPTSVLPMVAFVILGPDAPATAARFDIPHPH